jgi:hypothetical protein
MIELMFELGSEIVLVIIKGRDVKFGSSTYGAAMADISGLKLDYRGVIEEFPDLETADDWREQAINRFKEKIASMNSEEDIATYIIKELSSKGYVPKKKRREGFRPENL